MLFGFATRQLTAKPALNCLPAIADLLDRFLHGSLGPAGLLRLVSDLVILSTSYARPILLAPSAALFLVRHQLSPLFQSNAGSST